MHLSLVSSLEAWQRSEWWRYHTVLELFLIVMQTAFVTPLYSFLHIKTSSHTAGSFLLVLTLHKPWLGFTMTVMSGNTALWEFCLFPLIFTFSSAMYLLPSELAYQFGGCAVKLFKIKSGIRKLEKKIFFLYFFKSDWGSVFTKSCPMNSGAIWESEAVQYSARMEIRMDTTCGMQPRTGSNEPCSLPLCHQCGDSLLLSSMTWPQAHTHHLATTATLAQDNSSSHSAASQKVGHPYFVSWSHSWCQADLQCLL